MSPSILYCPVPENPSIAVISYGLLGESSILRTPFCFLLVSPRVYHHSDDLLPVKGNVCNNQLGGIRAWGCNWMENWFTAGRVQLKYLVSQAVYDLSQCVMTKFLQNIQTLEEKVTQRSWYTVFNLYLLFSYAYSCLWLYNDPFLCRIRYYINFSSTWQFLVKENSAILPLN